MFADSPEVCSGHPFRALVGFALCAVFAGCAGGSAGVEDLPINAGSYLWLAERPP